MPCYVAENIHKVLTRPLKYQFRVQFAFVFDDYECCSDHASSVRTSSVNPLWSLQAAGYFVRSATLSGYVASSAAFEILSKATDCL